MHSRRWVRCLDLFALLQVFQVNVTFMEPTYVMQTVVNECEYWTEVENFLGKMVELLASSSFPEHKG